MKKVELGRKKEKEKVELGGKKEKEKQSRIRMVS